MSVAEPHFKPRKHLAANSGGVRGGRRADLFWDTETQRVLKLYGTVGLVPTGVHSPGQSPQCVRPGWRTLAPHTTVLLGIVKGNSADWHPGQAAYVSPSDGRRHAQPGCAAVADSGCAGARQREHDQKADAPYLDQRTLRTRVEQFNPSAIQQVAELEAGQERRHGS
jgi:hypothetical protein